MSYFKKTKTEFEDQECLVAALGQMELAKGKDAVVHATKQKLKGYGLGEAEIVLPRGAFGNQYEAGFARSKDGKFELVVADDDKLDLKKLKRAYGEQKALQLARKQGMRLVGRQEMKLPNGTFQTKLILQPAGQR